MIEIQKIMVFENEKGVEVELAELKLWQIHEVKIKNLKSSENGNLTNNYIVYTPNRLLDNTPSAPPSNKKAEKKLIP